MIRDNPLNNPDYVSMMTANERYCRYDSEEEEEICDCYDAATEFEREID